MNYKIFLDLDGVLVDLASSIECLLGVYLGKYRHSTELHPQIIETLIFMYRRDEDLRVFLDAEMMPDALQLWTYLEEYPTEILSSTGPYFVERIEEEKTVWVRKHISDSITINLVHESHKKSEYAAPNHILIDDQVKSIRPWRNAGGIGILHTNTFSTINKLKTLGI